MARNDNTREETEYRIQDNEAGGAVLAEAGTREELAEEAARLKDGYRLYFKRDRGGVDFVGAYGSRFEAVEKMLSVSHDTSPGRRFYIEREGEGVVFGEGPA